MKKLIIAILFVLVGYTNTFAQKSINRVIYTPSIPLTCVEGYIYVNVATGFVYTYKTGVGCFLTTTGVSGTGISGRVAYWDGTSSIASTSGFSFDGTNLSIPIGGQFRINGTAFNFTNLAGNIAVSQMNSGIGASSSTYWRGDGTWASLNSVTTNSTTGSIPYLSASNVYSDSPISRINSTRVSLAGDLYFGTDNTYNIGSLGANRPANVYIGTELFSNTITVSNSGNCIRWLNRACMLSPSDGVIGLYNNGTTDFTRLQLGGTTSSFPAIGRSTSYINITDATGGTNGGLMVNGGSPLTSYIEGTWTPTLAFGGASTGITYTTQAGKYTRIGNVVNYTLTITLSSKGSATGTPTITLPITSGNTANQNAVAWIRGSGLTIIGQANAFISPNSPTMAIEINNNGTVTTGTDTNFTNTSSLVITGSYFL